LIRYFRIAARAYLFSSAMPAVMAGRHCVPLARSTQGSRAHPCQPMATHSEAHMSRALEVFGRVGRELGLVV
jgi:7-keto-8-aminopelargonate synthetase-like enzyme